MPIKLVMLDLDGTIVDTIASLREAVNRALALYGFPQRNLEEIRCAIGNGAKLLVRNSLPKEVAENEATVERVLAAFHNEYRQTYLHLDGCYEGMAESLQILYERGYKLAVLSNKPDGYVKGIVALLFPENMISIASGQTELPKKPDPTAALQIVQALGCLPEETVFVGDSDVDVLTGKNAGMRTVGCAWGYRGAQELQEAGADRVLNTAWELASCITEW